MTREFTLPDVGEGIAEGELLEWHVAEGEAVEEGQVVAEVETDKAVVDVPAPVDGTLVERRAEVGDVVPVGEVIAVFDVEGEPSGEPGEDGADADETAPVGETTGEDGPGADGDGATAEADSEAEPDVAEPVGNGHAVAPPSVRRLARELEVDLEAVAGSGVAGRVTRADVRAHADGVESPAAVAGGDRAEAPTGGASTNGTPSSGGTSGSAAASAPEASEAVSRETASRDTTLAPPPVRQEAKELDIDIHAVPASEERDGEAYVTEADLEAHVQRLEEGDAVERAAGQQSSAAQGAGGQVSAAIERVEAIDATDREPIREPYTGVRKSVGETMAESKFSAPHVTHFDEIDVTELVEVRGRLADAAEDHGVSLTYVPFVAKACVAALQDYPVLNATLDEEAGEIVKKREYNIGIATATDAGLMVPVVDDVDRKGLLALASETNELVQTARDRSIAPEEMRGGTFTVSNTGAVGGLFGTPILNPPESGILALGEIKRKPRVVTDEDGEESIEPRSIMTVSLSFDHRIVDGADAAAFTNTVKQHLENPELLLL